jgi:hypothetical protein
MVHIVPRTARTRKKAGLCNAGVETFKSGPVSIDGLTFPISRNIQNGILDGRSHRTVYAQLRIAYCGDVSHVWKP